MAETERAPRGSFTQALASLDAAQKSGVGVPAYTRWVNRRFARLFSASFFALGVSPSAVSAISILVTAAGLVSFLLLQATPVLAGIVAAVLLATGFALDSADGQLARLQGSSSKRGVWLDHTLDAVRLPSVHLTIAAALLLGGRPELAIAAAAFSVIASASFLSQNIGGFLRGPSEESRAGALPMQSWILLPVDTGVICWLFAFWGAPAIFAVLYLALLVTNAAHTLLSARRRWRELRTVDAA